MEGSRKRPSRENTSDEENEEDEDDEYVIKAKIARLTARVEELKHKLSLASTRSGKKSADNIQYVDVEQFLQERCILEHELPEGSEKIAIQSNELGSLFNDWCLVKGTRQFKSETAATLHLGRYLKQTHGISSTHKRSGQWYYIQLK